MSAADFCRMLSSFCETLIENELALGVQSHVVQTLGAGLSRVCWVSQSSAGCASDEDHYIRTLDLELSEYLRCLRTGDYSLLLNDGSLIQVSSDFRGSEVVASRFCYIPCLVKFDLSEIRIDDEIFPVEDFILELSATELLDRLCLRPPFRFELDPENKKEDHALNHVHMGKSASRVPVSAAMCWDQFARFVLSNFHPDVFEQVSHLLKFPTAYRRRTIADHHGLELHFSFNTAPIAIDSFHGEEQQTRKGRAVRRRARK